MNLLEMAISLCGLFCFPITMVIREWMVRRIWAIALLFAIIGSFVWLVQTSRNTSYAALGYAAVLIISAYLYFTSAKRIAVTVAASQSFLITVRENARWFVIGTSLVFVAAIYSCENRYQIVPEKGQSIFVKVLDRWTGEVTKK